MIDIDASSAAPQDGWRHLRHADLWNPPAPSRVRNWVETDATAGAARFRPVQLSIRKPRAHRLRIRPDNTAGGQTTGAARAITYRVTRLDAGLQLRYLGKHHTLTSR